MLRRHRFGLGVLLVAVAAPSLVGCVSRHAVLPSARNPSSAPAAPGPSARQAESLGSWLPAVVYRIAEHGAKEPANDWTAVLWLPEPPSRHEGKTSFVSASEYLSAVAMADQPAAVVTLDGPAEELQASRATLGAAGLPALGQTANGGYSGFYRPKHIFSFAPPEPTWRWLELRVPLADSTWLAVRFVRPTTCDDVTAHYREVVDWGSRSCTVDDDCSLYGGLDAGEPCSRATDRRTVSKLWRIAEIAEARRCPRPPHRCVSIRARCVDGACRK